LLTADNFQADTFSWSFNTSSGGMDLPRADYTNQGSASLLSYSPKSQMDYGTVLCRAANSVGAQVVPCVFHVIPAGEKESDFTTFFPAIRFSSKMNDDQPRPHAALILLRGL